MIKVEACLYPTSIQATTPPAGSTKVGLAFHPIKDDKLSGRTVKVSFRLRSGFICPRYGWYAHISRLAVTFDRPCCIRLPEHKVRHFISSLRNYAQHAESQREFINPRFAALNFALKVNK